MQCVDNLNTDLGGKRKLDAITAYITPELKQALEEWAEDESRSLSSLVVHLLNQAVKARQEKKEK